MRTRLLFSWLFAFLCFGALHAQILVKGRVLDGKNSQPISYANIGIINTRVGTISDGDGTYSLTIPAENDRDTLTFSALGYKLKSIPVSALTESIEILLF